MVTTGTITDIGIDYNTRKLKISTLLDTNEIEVVEQLKNENKLNIELKKYRKKRSINANNYFWELTTKLADMMRISKEELYFLLLQRYGQSEMVSVLATIDVRPYFKYYAEAGESNLNGKLFKHYKVYKGSSEMNTREMSILIEGLVDECKTAGIETKTPAELKSLLESWDNK